MSKSQQYFSVTGLYRLGGKAGLLGEYIEEAKTYVWHKTGVPGQDALLILRQLILPSQTKGSQTAQAIGKTLGMPSAQVRDVLNAFADLFLVNPLPTGATEGDLNSAQEYELMHEHLSQILAEAPEPALQKARDAEERLRFWKERSRAVFAPDIAGKPNFFLTRIQSCFTMPIPLLESLRLWRFAPYGEDRRILRRNLQAFCMRLMVVILPISLWIFWVYTDTYHIMQIQAEAPVASAVSTSDERDARACLTAVKWIETLVKSNRPQAAVAAARALQHTECYLLALPAAAVGLIGEPDKVKKALDEALDTASTLESFPRHMALLAVAQGFAAVGNAKEAFVVARKMDDHSNRIEALLTVAIALAKAGQINDANQAFDEVLASDFSVNSFKDEAQRRFVAETIVRDFAKQGKTIIIAQRYIPYRSHDSSVEGPPHTWQPILAAAAEARAREGKFAEALSIARMLDSSHRDQALATISKDFNREGKYDVALTFARGIGDIYHKASLLAILAEGLAKIGKTDEAKQELAELRIAAYNVMNDGVSIAARAILAEGLVKVGKIEEAKRELAELLTAVYNPKSSGMVAVFATMIPGLVKVGMTEEIEKMAAEVYTALSKREVDTFSIGIHRHDPLTAFAHALAKVGQVKMSFAIVREKETSSPFFRPEQGFSEDYTKSLSLYVVADELSKAGDVDATLTAIRELPDAHLRFRALDALSERLLKRDKVDVAKKVLPQTLNAARQIQNDKYRSKAMSMVSKRLACIQRYRQAHLTANEILSSPERLAAYTGILIEYTKAQNPNLRQHFAAEDAESKQEKELDDLLWFYALDGTISN